MSVVRITAQFVAATSRTIVCPEIFWGSAGRGAALRLNFEIPNPVADLRGGLVILVGYSFAQVLLQVLQLRIAFEQLRQPGGPFPNVHRSLVHAFEQRLQSFRKSLIAHRATEPAGLLEIRLAEAARRALLGAATA